MKQKHLVAFLMILLVGINVFAVNFFNTTIDGGLHNRNESIRDVLGEDSAGQNVTIKPEKQVNYTNKGNPEKQQKQHLGNLNSQTWYKGESVYIEREFPFRYPSSSEPPTIYARTKKDTPSASSVSKILLNYTSIQGDIMDLVADDSVYHSFESYDIISESSSGSSDGTYLAEISYNSSFVYSIPVSISGNISVSSIAEGTWKWSATGFITGGTFEAQLGIDILNTKLGIFETINMLTNSTSPSSGTVSSERSISTNIQYSAAHVMNNVLTMRLNVNLRVYAVGVADSTWGFPSASASVSMSRLSIGVDFMQLQQSMLSQNTRVSYRYVSPTVLEHRLVIEAIDYGETMRIYAPLSWNYSSITPNAGVRYDSANKYWVVTNTYPTTYTILFLSGDGFGVDYVRKPQLLALREISLDGLQFDPGFEDGKSQGWYNDVPNAMTHQWDTVELATNIVFDGSFSIHLQEVSGNDALLRTVVSKEDYYYFSFSYYMKSSTTKLRVAIYEGNGIWDITELQSNPYDRWNQFFWYGKIAYDNSNDRSLQIDVGGIGQTADVYIDSIRIYKPSTIITTLGLNAYGINGVLRSWDNRQNPTVPNADVQIQLRSRVEDVLVQRWQDVETLADGSFSVYASSRLEEKEYVVSVYSTQSWFGTPWTYDEQLDLANWYGGYMASYSEVQEKDYVKFDWNATTTHIDLGYIYFKTSTTWDLTNFDVLVFETYSPSVVDYVSLDVVTAWYNNATVAYFRSDPTSWETFVLEYGGPDSTWDDFASRSEWSDLSEKEVFEILLELFDDGDETTYIRNLHVIQAQKTFFTPTPAGNVLYQYENQNEWDYSEGTLDGYFTSSGISSVLNSDDGYLRITTNYRTYGADFYFSSKTISDYYAYPKIIFRVRYSTLVESDGIDVLVKFNTGTGSYPGLSYYYTLSSEWQTFEFDFSGSPYWDKNAYPNGRLYLTFSCLANSTIHAGNVIELDFVRLANIKPTQTYKTDTHYVLNSENSSLTYYVFSDGSFAGYFSDLEFVPINSTIGQHNITALPVLDSIESFPRVFIPNYKSRIELFYEIKEEFVVSVFDFGLSDYYVQTFITASKDGTYTIYENNTQIASGSFSKTGTSIQTLRNTLAGVLVLYAIKFTNSSDVVWFNVSYSNAEQTLLSFALRNLDFSYDVASGTLNFYITTTWQNATVNIYDNNTLLGSGAEGAITTFFTPSYGYHNITLNITGGANWIWIEYGFSIVSETQYETILIYVYDLSGQRIYEPVWDLYYNNSILETYAATVPNSTFDPALVSFRDLFGNVYPAILINQTTSLQGYKGYQFQLQGHEIVLFNEASDKLANLAIYYDATDSWVNYTLAPKEERRVWLANTTYSFYAFVADLDEFALAGENMTLELVGNATKTVSESFKFGITANLRSLLGGDDITSQTFIEQSFLSEQQKYALYYQGEFLGIPVDIRISWSQLWYLIIVGLFTLAFAVFRVYVSKYTEEYIDEKGKKRRRAKPGAEHVENVVKTIMFVSLVAIIGLITKAVLT